MRLPDGPDRASHRVRKHASRHRRRPARALLIRPLLAAAVVLTASVSVWSAMWLSARPDAVTTALPDVTQTVVTTAPAHAATRTAPGNSRRPSAAPTSPAAPTVRRTPTGPTASSAATPPAPRAPVPAQRPAAGSVTSSGSASVTGRQATVHVTISAGTPLQVTVTAHFTGPNGSQALTLASNVPVTGTITVSGSTTLPAGATSWTYSIAAPGQPVMTSAPAALG